MVEQDKYVFVTGATYTNMQYGPTGFQAVPGYIQDQTIIDVTFVHCTMNVRFRNCILRNVKFEGCQLRKDMFEGVCVVDNVRASDSCTGVNYRFIKSMDGSRGTIHVASHDLEVFKIGMEHGKGTDPIIVPKEENKLLMLQRVARTPIHQMIERSLYDDEYPRFCLIVGVIPAGARYIFGERRKCRADRFLTKEIWRADGKRTECRGMLYKDFTYEAGVMATPVNGFNPDTGKTCGSGIHFFFNEMDALEYLYEELEEM